MRKIAAMTLAVLGVGAAASSMHLTGCDDATITEEEMLSKQREMEEGARNLPGMTDEQFAAEQRG